MPQPISPELAVAALAKTKEEIERRKRSRQISAECGKSFSRFVPEAWNIVDPAKPFIPNAWHIGAICEHVQAVADKQIQNLLMVVPPGSAKSTLVSVLFPAWKWIKDPGWRSTFASYEATLSTRDSVRCRELMESLWYQETFQPAWKFSSAQNEKTYYVNSEKGFRISTSVDGRGTGWRSSAIIIDDALSTSARYSEPTLKACIDWYETVFHNRLIDLSTDSRIIIGQRVSDNDLIGHLLRKGGWELLLIPMEYDPTRSRVTSIGWKDPRKKAGDIMFEPLFPPKVIEDLKRNEDRWATQYMGSPNVEGGGILKAHKWNYWRPRGLDLPKVRVRIPGGGIDEREAVELPTQFDMELQSWDFTFKDLKTSDYVAGAAIGVRGANRFVRKMVREKLDLPGSVAAVRQMTADFPSAHLKLVEGKANGPAVIQSLRNEISGLTEVEPEGNKISRAAAMTPDLNSGNWYLPHPSIAPWVGNPENPTETGFLAEATLFPFGAHDDMCDALSQGNAHIQKAQIGGVFGVAEDDIRVDQFDFDAKWPRMYGLAITWNEVSAVWMCRQPETGQYYLYGEYSVYPTSPAQHSAAILKVGDWIQGVVTPTDIGRTDVKDGYSLIGKYRALGLKLDSIPENEETMILDVQDALRSGKLKVFGNLAALLNQYRVYRRDDKGKLPTSSVGMIKAVLVAWAGKDRTKAPPEQKKQNKDGGNTRGNPSMAWMSS